MSLSDKIYTLSKYMLNLLRKPRESLRRLACLGEPERDPHVVRGAEFARHWKTNVDFDQLLESGTAARGQDDAPNPLRHILTPSRKDRVCGNGCTTLNFITDTCKSSLVDRSPLSKLASTAGAVCKCGDTTLAPAVRFMAWTSRKSARCTRIRTRRFILGIRQTALSGNDFVNQYLQ